MNDMEKSIIKLRQLEAEERKKKESRQQANMFDAVFGEREKQPTKTWNYFDDVFERRT